MAGRAKGKLPKITRHAFAVKFRVRQLMESLIPLPCMDLMEQTGYCDELECLTLDGNDPLCRTRRLLGDELAAAIQINRYDPLHPEYDRLPDGVKALLLKVHRRKIQGVAVPDEWARKQREDGDKKPKRK